MGATNTKPETVHIPNPFPFQVSHAVIRRLEAKHRAELLREQHQLQQQQPKEKVIFCENCGQNTKKTPTEETVKPLYAYTPLEAAIIAGATVSSSSKVSPKSPTAATPTPTPVLTSTAANKASTQQKPKQTKYTSEVEEIQFDKTLDRLNKLFGQPVHWAKEYSTDIDALKHRVINCYREYRQEPLMCAGIAKQFHTFIFKKHFDAILQMNPDDVSDKGVQRDCNKIDVHSDLRKNCSQAFNSHEHQKSENE